MTISLKSDAGGNSGAIQVAGVDRLTLNLDGSLVAGANPATGNRSMTLATMQKFADEFVASKSASGYQKLASGLIIQWGSVGSSNAGAVVVTLPVAFPNAGFQAFSTPKDTYNGNASAAEIISISQLKVSAWVPSGGGWARTSTQIQWFAIGH